MGPKTGIAAGHTGLAYATLKNSGWTEAIRIARRKDGQAIRMFSFPDESAATAARQILNAHP